MEMQSVHRALDILEFLAERPSEPQPLSDIAASAGLHLSTCANILKTLVARSYAEQPVPRGGYMLGPMAQYLVRHGAYRRDLVALTEPLLRELATHIPENFVLARLHQGRLFMLCQVSGEGAIQVRDDIVLADDVYYAANGRVLLAHASAQTVQSIVATRGLPGDSWPEVQSLEELQAALAAIRSREVFADVTPRQVARVSCPLRQGEQIVAAVGLYAPAFRFTGDYRERAIGGLQALAAQVSEQLTEGGPPRVR